MRSKPDLFLQHCTKKITAGVSLAVIFLFVLQKNLSLWSASQF